MKRITRLTLMISAILAVAAIILATRLEIKKPEDYYSNPSGSLEDGDFEVTMSIDCSIVLDHMDDLDATIKDSGLLPKDGIILRETRFFVNEGDSVFDLLVDGTRQNKIQLEYSGSPDGGISVVYIKSLGHLYEFACGPLSGWMFRVNGKFPGSDPSGIPLGPGDDVEWVFTCDLGKDVGNDYTSGGSE